MPVIHLTTIINAPIDVVFNLSRDIDLHQTSMQHTSEKAIAGVTSGLINEGEIVTWKAKHLFAVRIMTVKITSLIPYTFFKDEMVKGDFKLMKHNHHFKSIEANITEMKDEFYFESPFGLFGKIFNTLFLTNYMKNLLQKRNEVIKRIAEGIK
ncbi:MAG: cell division protein [Chitinophaga sp.]|jgi:hypothetical protein|nr:cell division protein [Chitinophaga sp.]